jgi:hypothetical protein
MPLEAEQHDRVARREVVAEREPRLRTDDAGARGGEVDAPPSTMPASAGVSPPPQDIPHCSQACFQPRRALAARCASSNQSEPPAAQYAWTTSGVAPTVTRSLTAIAIVSCAMPA